MAEPLRNHRDSNTTLKLTLNSPTTHILHRKPTTNSTRSDIIDRLSRVLRTKRPTERSSRSEHRRKTESQHFKATVHRDLAPVASTRTHRD
jgi:hypothetical protein